MKPSKIYNPQQIVQKLISRKSRLNIKSHSNWRMTFFMFSIIRLMSFVKKFYIFQLNFKLRMFIMILFLKVFWNTLNFNMTLFFKTCIQHLKLQIFTTYRNIIKAQLYPFYCFLNTTFETIMVLWFLVWKYLPFTEFCIVLVDK